MAVARWHLDADDAGSMVDRLREELHETGRDMIEMRNIQRDRGDWDLRWGWAKANLAAIPCNTFCGGAAFRDTQDTLHIVVVGGDGHLYASVDGGATFQQVTMHVSLYWDETYVAEFAKHGDDLLICIGAVSGDAQNIRYDGVTAQAFGVSITAPETAPTVAEGAVGGSVPDGQHDYFITFHDAGTGRRSDRSPIATVTLTRPDAPGAAPLLAQGGAGNVVADVPHRYYYTFYEATTGVESEPSNHRSITPDANSQIDITDIRVCPDAGTWHRRIYRDDDGGGYLLLATIADNTTTTYTDNAAAPPGALYEAQDRYVELTDIPTSGETGRTIYRNIWRQDDGNGYALLATIEDDTTTTYTDDFASAPGESYAASLPIPVCSAVGFNRDGRAIYGNDRENDEPARIYVADLDNPERLSNEEEGALSIQSAGTSEDPITGIIGVRDGVAIFKRRAIHWLSRHCRGCEGMIEGIGAVAGATVRNVGSVICFLSDMGPAMVSHAFEEDWAFIGPTPRRFCLAQFWEGVLKGRLPYATATHDRRRSVIEWHVQRCEHDDDYVSDYGNHNDTSIVWDYAMNRVGVADRMIDCGFEVPSESMAYDRPYGAFPLGYVGPLVDGKHGDGVDAAIKVQVLSADGVNITIGDTNLLTGEPLELDAAGWRGSVFYVTEGSGSHVCERTVLPCWRPHALIVDHSVKSGIEGRVVKTATALGVDETSKAWIGGFLKREWLGGIDGGDPDAIKTMPRCDLQIRGEDQ